MPSEIFIIARHKSKKGDATEAQKQIEDRWTQLVQDDPDRIARELGITSEEFDLKHSPFKATIGASGVEGAHLLIHFMGDIADGLVKGAAGFVGMQGIKLLWEKRIAPYLTRKSPDLFGQELENPSATQSETPKK
jgi:hypothetical protein